jgi:uncharacterized cupredoxin-like copper-binding protein
VKTVFAIVSSAALAVAFLVIAGPAAAAPDTYFPYAGDVAKVDWNRMQTVVVNVADNSYEPRDLRFKAGEPYKLVVRNSSKADHYFTAPEFFRAIATRKVQIPKAGEVKAPFLTAVEVYKNGGEIELFFVPLAKGTYDVFCTIDDHREKGHAGHAVIE